MAIDEPRREPPTLADYLVTAISPILIMLMVGSLVFFLVEVLYRGPYVSRVLYILFFFVGAAVLVCRIAVDRGYHLAGIYGLGLGLATLVALNLFVDYPKAMQLFALPINVAIMAMVWWVANKLVWDCTHFDDARKASGQGVLMAAGLGSIAEKPAAGEIIKSKKKDPDGALGWWARYQRYRAAQKEKPHTSGVWIVYLGLAGLPLFALGQSLVPSSDGGRRRAIFLQMAVYVGSALMLLVTTGFLGLRKYLRERGAKVPASLTMGWLGLGAALVAGFLVLGAILPRPHSETPLVDLGRGGKRDRNASKYAQVKDDSAGKGDGAKGKRNEAGDGNKSAKGGKQQGGKAGEKGDGGGKGDDKGGNQKGDGKGDKNDGDGKKNDGKDGDGKKNKDDNNNKGPANEEGDKPNRDADGDGEEGGDGEGENTSPPSQLLESLSSGLRWLVWVVVAILVIAAIAVFFLKFLSPFTAWARGLLDWLRSLFSAKERAAQEKLVEEETEEAISRPPPFAVYRNPFDDGSDGRKSVEDLIEYTFAATDAWAWDRSAGRRAHETPTEFAVRLAGEYPDLHGPVQRLVALFVRVQYSTSALPPNSLDVLRDVWNALESAR